jgi:hypothetical protein
MHELRDRVPYYGFSMYRAPNLMLNITVISYSSEHRELYSNMGMRIEYTIFLMMRLKSFRPEIDKNWQPWRECQKYKKKVSNK